MDEYISNIIEDQIECGREKQKRFNHFRKLQRRMAARTDYLMSNSGDMLKLEIDGMDIDYVSGTNLHFEYDSTASNSVCKGEKKAVDGDDFDDMVTDTDYVEGAGEYGDNEDDDTSFDDNELNIFNDYYCPSNSETNDTNDYDDDNDDDNDYDGGGGDEDLKGFDFSIDQRRLHPYTNMKTVDVCQQFVHLIRDSQISKHQTEKFLKFIKNILPTPNSFPKKMSNLLRLIDVKTCFNKRMICSLCGKNVNQKGKKCDTCSNFEKKNLIYVYDTHFGHILSTIMKRVWDDIKIYKKKIYENDYKNNNETYDIPFASTYRTLLKIHEKDFISLLLHIDGISLCKSTKLKMWLFSSSILELPPILRYRRSNMPLISVWVGCSEPNIMMWLGQSFEALKLLKADGIFIFINYA